jgi:hypothetical protein
MEERNEDDHHSNRCAFYLNSRLRPAYAACPDATGSISSGAKTGMAKDGTRAPLQTDTKSATTPEVNQNPTKKDGNTMPLADQEGGGNKDLATSQQDVEAQQ